MLFSIIVLSCIRFLRDFLVSCATLAADTAAGVLYVRPRLIGRGFITFDASWGFTGSHCGGRGEKGMSCNRVMYR